MTETREELAHHVDVNPIIYVYPDCILFIGKIPKNDWHAMPTETLAANILSEFHARTDLGDTFMAKTIFYPSGVTRKTSYSENNILAFFLFPKYSQFSVYVQKNMLHEIPYASEFIKTQISNEQKWLAILKNAYQQRLTAMELKQDLKHFFGVSNADDLFKTQMNVLSRVTKEIISAIKSAVNNGDELNLDECTQKYCSLQHARRLFKKEVGTSIKKFYTHHRMIRVLFGRLQGLNLTQSTINAGYYDYSHASKFHKQAYGIPIDSSVKKGDVMIDESVAFI